MLHYKKITYLILLWSLIFFLNNASLLAQKTNTEQEKDLIITLKNNVNKSRKYFRNHQYDSAKIKLNPNLADSLLFSENQGVKSLAVRSYHLLVNILWTSTQFDSTAYYATKILNNVSLDPENKCYFLFQLAEAQYRLSNTDQAIETAKRIIRIINNEPFESASVRLFRTYQLLGLICLEEDKMQEAKDYFLYCINHFELKSDQNTSALQAYGNLGILFGKLKEYDSAVYYYDQALNSIDYFKGGPAAFRIPYLKAKIFTNVSTLYYDQEAYDKAYSKLLEAENYLKPIYQPDNELQIFIESQQGINLSYMSRHEEAISLLKEALRKFKKKYTDHHEFVMEGYFNIANAYRNNNNFQIAMAYYDSALSKNTKKPILGEQIYSHMELAIAIIQNRFNTQKKMANKIDFHQALQQAHQEIIAQSNYINSYLSNKVTKLLLRDFCTELLYNIDSLYKIENNEQLLEKAWEIIELNKAGKINQQKKFLSSLVEIPSYLKSKEKVLRKRIQSYVSNPTSNQSDSILFDLNNQMKELKNNIRSNYPRYFDLHYANNLPSLISLRSNIKSNTVLVSFFEHNDAFFAFSITKDKIDFENFSFENNQLIYERLGDFFNKSIFNDAEQLIIIPDGKIWSVNFDLIPSKNQKLGYLIEKCPILYKYSSFTLVNKLLEQIMIKRDRILAFSYSDKVQNGGIIDFEKLRDQSYKELPGTSEEIKNISAFIPGEYFYGNKASEFNFKEKAEDFSILHLALHGDISSKNPNDFKLIFQHNEDTIEDGYLHARELYQMNLKAKLAVLSACNTGSGKIETGEGIQSLGRAFSYAGVPSLLISREAVSDISTPIIMKHFYEGLKKGMRKSQALRYAKLKYLANSSKSQLSASFYWSSFYILGEDYPVFSDSSNIQFYIILAAALIISLFLYLYFKGKFSLV